VVEVEIHDGTGKLLCGGTFTMFCTGSLDEVPAD
jgi:acyl-coenzyme A thioesterase PaaI-like protein